MLLFYHSQVSEDIVTKTESFDGVEYTLSTITIGSAKKSLSMYPEDGKPLANREFNTRLIMASLTAGGHDNAPDIVDSFPMFDGSIFTRFLQSSMDVNGLKIETPKVGEDESGASEAPKESIGS